MNSKSQKGSGDGGDNETEVNVRNPLDSMSQKGGGDGGDNETKVNVRNPLVEEKIS